MPMRLSLTNAGPLSGIVSFSDSVEILMNIKQAKELLFVKVLSQIRISVPTDRVL